MVRRILSAVVLLAIAHSASAQDAPSLRTSFRSRAIQPGEVVRLDVVCRCGDARPVARAFDNEVLLFSLDEPGRWRGLIGIDVETKPGTYRVTVTVDRNAQAPIVSTRLLHVLRRRFTTRRLRVDPSFVEPPASAHERIEREARLMEALFTSNAPQRWDGPFRLPVPQPPVSNFGVRSVFNGRPRNPHAGVDFGSPAGTPIAAPGAGRVVLADALYFTGNTVIVDHGLGLFSVFAHLSKIGVQKDEDVGSGDVIGLVGATGRVTGPHLHWSVRLHGARVDPLSLVAALRQDTNTKTTKGTKGRNH